MLSGTGNPLLDAITRDNPRKPQVDVRPHHVPAGLEPGQPMAPVESWPVEKLQYDLFDLGGNLLHKGGAWWDHENPGGPGQAPGGIQGVAGVGSGSGFALVSDPKRDTTGLAGGAPTAFAADAALAAGMPTRQKSERSGTINDPELARVSRWAQLYSGNIKPY